MDSLPRSWRTKGPVEMGIKSQPPGAQSRVVSGPGGASGEYTAQNVSTQSEALQEPLGRKISGREVPLGYKTCE